MIPKVIKQQLINFLQIEIMRVDVDNQMKKVDYYESIKAQIVTQNQLDELVLMNYLD